MAKCSLAVPRRQGYALLHKVSYSDCDTHSLGKPVFFDQVEHACNLDDGKCNAKLME